ncbi:hypothetical protein SSOG_02343 [Streptomyces himastatinicus ATCC 53653]|uniref:Uncharacterized protein n=1 Tax=Streptomyces himastatinicus ATCC 53653 TaxID=457427 RepID=D9W8C2_9ACTN|nr:hypothetical protein [Streptomyces himastatinicus]EFL22629.1 hypothetical protein SSOG_02343 [Streptomyces himastatinicus ATCC 53653]
MSALLNFFRSEHSQVAFAKVRAESRAETIVRVLNRRGFEVVGMARERIQLCTDLELLGDWLDGALTVSSTTDLCHMLDVEPNIFFRSNLGQRAFTDVRIESRAEDIVRILGQRGLEVTGETRQRIEACRDLDVLATWLDRAVTASRAEELFADA